jgi:hypothetical protein
VLHHLLPLFRVSPLAFILFLLWFFSLERTTLLDWIEETGNDKILIKLHDSLLINVIPEGTEVIFTGDVNEILILVKVVQTEGVG